MTLKISTDLAIVACDALVDAVDAGPAISQLVLFDGTAPTGLSDAITTQKALVAFDLPEPCFGASASITGGARATANAIAQVRATEDGTAKFFRVVDGNGVAIWQGDITAVGGGGDLELSTTTVVSGIDVIVVSWTATMPTG